MGRGPGIVRAEQALLDFLREPIRVTERHDLHSMRDVRAQVAKRYPAMGHDFTWLRLESLRRTRRECDYRASWRGRFDVFYRARNEVVLYDDVRPALDRLARTHRLFAISNGNADLGVIGLGRLFRGQPECARSRHAETRPAHLRDAAATPGLRATMWRTSATTPRPMSKARAAPASLPVWLNRDGCAGRSSRRRPTSSSHSREPAEALDRAALMPARSRMKSSTASVSSSGSRGTEPVAVATVSTSVAWASMDGSSMANGVWPQRADRPRVSDACPT